MKYVWQQCRGSGMDSDSYTPAIPIDELTALAKRYGPASLANAGDPSVSRDLARHSVEQALCPCIRGDACVCDAIAEEFLRLARLFRQQRNKNNPAGCPPCIDRWENEGGSPVDGEAESSG
jgi:hypothetical protein